MEAAQRQDQEPGQAEQLADQAREKVGEAADQAKETAQGIAAQAQQQIRQQVDQRSTEAGERIGGTAEDIRSVGEELRNQGKDGPAKLAEQAADRIGGAAGYLRDADADRILSDAEDFGRSRPWAVVAGAAVAGLAAARFLKASSRQRYSTRQAGRGPNGVSVQEGEGSAESPASAQGDATTAEFREEAAAPTGAV
jgi:ElaB/YqjD/DUF883 family membrane-anchored ribosome-binding protein